MTIFEEKFIKWCEVNKIEACSFCQHEPLCGGLFPPCVSGAREQFRISENLTSPNECAEMCDSASAPMFDRYLQIVLENSIEDSILGGNVCSFCKNGKDSCIGKHFLVRETDET